MIVFRKLPNWKVPVPAMSRALEFDFITWQITGVFARVSRLWGGGPCQVDKMNNSASTKR